MLLTADQLRTFAVRGYVVVPNAVSSLLIDKANASVDDLIRDKPPPADHRGFHFYWRNGPEIPEAFGALLTQSPVLAVAEELIAPRTLNLPNQAQISLNIPPYHHRPGGGHLDGLTPPEPSGRPGTFTCLAGIFLSDQRSRDMGNLWVWPGSHSVIARYLRQNGPDALFDIVYPDLGFDPPEQVVGSAGDLLLAHYLLAHNMGGNTSATTRRVVYFRLRSTEHVEHWREYVQDELFEFKRCRALL